jgi:hypothetical protein
LGVLAGGGISGAPWRRIAPPYAVHAE